MHELCDAGSLDVRLEVAESVVGVRINRIDGHVVPLLRTEPEAHRRLALPRADLDDDAVAAATPGELVASLTLRLGQPAGGRGPERLDACLEVSRRTRHCAGASIRFRFDLSAHGRATGTSPRDRRGRAHSWSTCGRRRRPRARTRSCRALRA